MKWCARQREKMSIKMWCLFMCNCGTKKINEKTFENGEEEKEKEKTRNCQIERTSSYVCKYELDWNLLCNFHLLRQLQHTHYQPYTEQREKIVYTTHLLLISDTIQNSSSPISHASRTEFWKSWNDVDPIGPLTLFASNLFSFFGLGRPGTRPLCFQNEFSRLLSIVYFCFCFCFLFFSPVSFVLLFSPEQSIFTSLYDQLKLCIKLKCFTNNKKTKKKNIASTYMCVVFLVTINL